MSNFEHDRSHYRIRYPLEVRPTLRLEADGGEFAVVDCSETGLRYATDGLTPEIGTETGGTIRFQVGGEVAVAGVVVRVQAGEVAVHLTRLEIPWRVIFQEQRFLMQRYPLSLLTG